MHNKRILTGLMIASMTAGCSALPNVGEGDDVAVLSKQDSKSSQDSASQRELGSQPDPSKWAPRTGKVYEMLRGTFDQSAEAIGSKRKKPVSPSQPSSEADTDEDSTVGAGTSAHAGASTSADASAGAGTSASATAGAGTSASATAGAGTSASATADAGASTSAAAGAPGPASSSARAAPSKPPRQVTLQSILSSTTTALQSRSVDVYE